MRTIKDSIRDWMSQNQLLYIKLLTPRNGMQVLWGRIIRYDEKQNLLIFYHDDEKRTYHVILNEIEEIQPANVHQIQNKNIRSFSAKQIQTVNNLLSKAKKYNDIYQEVQHLISKLTAEELTAILPILYHFIQTRKNIDSK